MFDDRRVSIVGFTWVLHGTVMSDEFLRSDDFSCGWVCAWGINHRAINLRGGLKRTKIAARVILEDNPTLVIIWVGNPTLSPTE